ncbi:YtxH domain-containing protein [Halalkalibacter flavus]|uniref:YtxH domain-containing protein n=1 Tax=Halalkalibacter flavus TaxID=3090668 RepID=UPI002FCA6C5B
MNTKSFLSGLFVGSTIVGAITLLTTPTTGKDLRTSCKESAIKVQKGFEQLAKDSQTASIQLKTTAKVGKETFETVGEEVKGSINNWKEDVEPALNQLKKDIEALQKNVEQSRKAID